MTHSQHQAYHDPFDLVAAGSFSKSSVSIEPVSAISKIQLEQFLLEHWGSPLMSISTGQYHLMELRGFAALCENRQIAGLITYEIHSQEKYTEVISLDSIYEGKGIGSSLLQAVEHTAQQAGCIEVQMITTNDNLQALSFYQKRGYVLKALYVDAVQQARRYKPAIPLIADNGIPIRDELLLAKRFVFNENKSSFASSQISVYNKG